MYKKEESFKEKYIHWFSELSKEDVKKVGGKGANLGEMYNAGMPVPPGFVITAESYKYFLEKTGLGKKIYEILNRIDIENTAELEETAKVIQTMIVEASLPVDMEEEIVDAYEALSFNEENLRLAGEEAKAILKKGQEPIFVAVRSSATAEDTEKASFAGQQETYLNVKGERDLLLSIKKCYASLFSPRSIYYRVRKGFKHEEVLIAVVVQQMVNSDKSGVIFSRDPVEFTDNIVIEAVFGLGEGIVSGRIKPDHYVVSRGLKILKQEISEKKVAIVRDSSGKTIIVKLTPEKGKSRVLTKDEIIKLAEYALRLEDHYKLPQDIEFAIDSGKIYIVQTRPVTTLKKKVEVEEVKGKEILVGQPASPGIGSGEVKIILDLSDLKKIVKGDILVTKMTNPDMVVTMQKCSGIVTEEGGSTCHAAIVSREMGIPAVVGTGTATSVLKDGQIVTVDGFKGKVYEGRAGKVEVEIKPIVETKTKIKVMVDLPSFAERSAKSGCKSVGLLRIEGIIAESGMHPFGFLKENRIKEYEEIIFNGISKIGEYFDELWIRTSDVRSDEYRHLRGAPTEVELNPMLGMHGIRAGLKYPEILKAELKAASKLAREKTVGIMMPQIISADEVRAVKEILKELKINNLILGIMVETPAASMIIEELCKEGIKFISFGTNDLTQYTLAIDRGNEMVQYLYDEMHPAVLRQLAFVIKNCKKYNVETSICGQAGSKKEMVEFLVKHGIDSISVNADKAYEISEFVKELEDKGLRGSELEKEEEKNETNQELKVELKDSKAEMKETIESKPSQEEYSADFSINVFEEQNKNEAQRESKIEEKTPERIQKISEQAIQTLEISQITEEQVKEIIKDINLTKEFSKEKSNVQEQKNNDKNVENIGAKDEKQVIEDKENKQEEIQLNEKKLENERLEGIVKFFKIKGNYGFIKGNDGKEYFAHRSEVQNNENLVEGEKVSFKVEETERGLKAVNIIKTN
ncbi:MAG: phosphoenolpyruvate synthase [Candidatus Pacearchaeota archaeon]